MRREDISDDLWSVACDFFYQFSRFEFALKENNYLKCHKADAKAEPGWGEFAEKLQGKYVISADAQALLNANPNRQLIAENGGLKWEKIHFKDGDSELTKVVGVLKTVRNNLFHGGKHGDEGWDDPSRTRLLLTLGNAVLDQLALLGEFEPDYSRRY